MKDHGVSGIWNMKFCLKTWVTLVITIQRQRSVQRRTISKMRCSSRLKSKSQSQSSSSLPPNILPPYKLYSIIETHDGDIWTVNLLQSLWWDMESSEMCWYWTITTTAKEEKSTTNDNLYRLDRCVLPYDSIGIDRKCIQIFMIARHKYISTLIYVPSSIMAIRTIFTLCCPERKIGETSSFLIAKSHFRIQIHLHDQQPFYIIFDIRFHTNLQCVFVHFRWSNTKFCNWMKGW